mmetsp:Transcript_31551/g.35321  ORF Transcript_31551/g.35321 Transcript_31551/m.35321 type:complete len:113 (-) Transcript_31551:58-396(-)|eukprot:CAMPEP_0170855182 /NCGR_PEP_ID=MMETSP0734-20130129/13739_1 /TAXON_ID=186038 /ORGANISM="Fragilariopsis kerguelensis, Strain L26-C5" /LENGTH=112 /DNA_ID=CAMNT_0011226569 /DNA_START=580 /DNA_END=918 /DNA_ORIENTATION=+
MADTTTPTTAATIEGFVMEYGMAVSASHNINYYANLPPPSLSAWQTDAEVATELVLTATGSAASEKTTTTTTATSNDEYLEWLRTGCLPFDCKEIKYKVIIMDEHTGELVTQ